jgi:hypothetical protein
MHLRNLPYEYLVRLQLAGRPSVQTLVRSRLRLRSPRFRPIMITTRGNCHFEAEPPILNVPFKLGAPYGPNGHAPPPPACARLEKARASPFLEVNIGGQLQNDLTLIGPFPNVGTDRDANDQVDLVT